MTIRWLKIVHNREQDGTFASMMNPQRRLAFVNSLISASLLVAVAPSSAQEPDGSPAADKPGIQEEGAQTAGGAEPPGQVERGRIDRKPVRKTGTPPVSQSGRHQAARKPEFASAYGSHLEPILERIKASEDQRIRISEIVMSYKPKIQPMREAYNQKKQEFLNSLLGGKDPEIVMCQQVELGKLCSDIKSQYCFMHLEIRRLLNPEQIVQFEEYRRQQGWNH